MHGGMARPAPCGSAGRYALLLFYPRISISPYGHSTLANMLQLLLLEPFEMPRLPAPKPDRTLPRADKAAPWPNQVVRSLFQAAILARRSALDSRLLRSLPRPPSLCASLQ